MLSGDKWSGRAGTDVTQQGVPMERKLPNLKRGAADELLN